MMREIQLDTTPMDWNAIADAATKWNLSTFWLPSDKRFRPAVPPDSKDLPFDFMWADGIAFSMFVGGAHFHPGFYVPYIENFFQGLEGYWDPKAAVPGYNAYLTQGGSDKYYDDNAWMVLTFVEAYELTKQRRFLDRAEETMKFVLSGWDEKLGGGIYWREDHTSKNTCSNGPAAAAALVLARHVHRKEYITWAERIVKWTRHTLQDKDGLYFDNIHIDNGNIEKTKWTYNTALMLRSHVELWRQTHVKAHRDEAVRLAEASEKTFVLPETGAFRDAANFSHLLCEAYLELWKEVKSPWLLKRVESNARFAATKLKDSDGGYKEDWRNPNKQEPRKTLMANASTARLFWSLAACLPTSGDKLRH